MKQNQPMSNERLAELDRFKRGEGLPHYSSGDDIPDLVAEVRRLQEELKPLQQFWGVADERIAQLKAQLAAMRAALEGWCCSADGVDKNNGCWECDMWSPMGQPVPHKDNCKTAKALSGDAGRELLEWLKTGDIGTPSGFPEPVWYAKNPPEFLKGV